MKSVLGRAIKFYKNLPIRRKILLILYIQIIIPLVLIGFMSYRISTDIIKNKSIDYTQDILKTIELRLNDYINKLNVLSQDLEYDDRIYSIISYGAGAEDPKRANAEGIEINSILKQFISSRNEIQSIGFMDMKGKIYSRDSSSNKININSIIKEKEGEIRIEAQKGKGKPVWYVDSKDQKNSNVFLLRSIYDRESFEEIGMMVILLKKEFIENAYQDLITESMQNIAIISTDGKQIVSRDKDNKYLLDKNLQDSIKDKTGVLVDNRTNSLVSYITLEKPDWEIVTYISLNVLYKEIGTLRVWIILLSIASVVLVSILSLFIAMDFINPINKLVNAMGRMPKGENFVPVEIDRSDELGFLNKAFNDMSQEINHLVTWIYREQITRKDAEIKALQAQINPHFLFNTLESINWMAQLNNVPEISKTVSALSSLMEASIGRDDKLITLKDEFTYIDNYISILKVRFEDRIELRKNIQQNILQVKIPRLLIQPLIENAVYHGIEKIRGKGVINLNAIEKEGTLFIEVEDNGPGIEEDELAALNEKLSMGNDEYFRMLNNNSKKSIGIENVNRRIKLFYGEAFGLKLESTKERFTRVVVAIPARDKIRSMEEHYV